MNKDIIKSKVLNYIEENIDNVDYIICPYYLGLKYDFKPEANQKKIGVGLISYGNINKMYFTQDVTSDMIHENTPFLLYSDFGESLLYENGNITNIFLNDIKDVYKVSLGMYDDPVIKTNYGIYKVMNSI